MNFSQNDALLAYGWGRLFKSWLMAKNVYLEELAIRECMIDTPDKFNAIKHVLH